MTSSCPAPAVCAHEFYAATRIKTHLDNTLYLSSLWSDLSKWGHFFYCTESQVKEVKSEVLSISAISDWAVQELVIAELKLISYSLLIEMNLYYSSKETVKYMIKEWYDKIWISLRTHLNVWLWNLNINWICLEHNTILCLKLSSKKNIYKCYIFPRVLFDTHALFW